MKHQITWYSLDRVTKNITDYSILDAYIIQFMTDVRVYNRYFEFDQRFLVTKLTILAKQIGRF